MGNGEISLKISNSKIAAVQHKCQINWKPFGEFSGFPKLEISPSISL